MEALQGLGGPETQGTISVGRRLILGELFTSCLRGRLALFSSSLADLFSSSDEDGVGTASERVRAVDRASPAARTAHIPISLPPPATTVFSLKRSSSYLCSSQGYRRRNGGHYDPPRRRGIPLLHFTATCSPVCGWPSRHPGLPKPLRRARFPCRDAPYGLARALGMISSTAESATLDGGLTLGTRRTGRAHAPFLDPWLRPGKTAFLSSF